MTTLALTAPSSTHRRARLRVAGLVFLQMMPATMLSAVVRPLFAAQHGSDEGAMHAFLSVGMLGALVAAPWVGRWLDRAPRAATTALACTAGTDAFLFLALGLPLPTSVVLVLRTLEGGAHLAASTILLAHAARLRSEHHDARALPSSGAALLAAVALGNALGGALVRLGLLAPFVVGAGVLGLVALLGPGALRDARATESTVSQPRGAGAEVVFPWRALAVPLGAAFVERFGVGCMVVSFSLYARAQHALDDRAIGLLYAAMTGSFALAMYPSGRLAEGPRRGTALALGALAYAGSLVGLALAPRTALLPCMLVGGLASAPMYAGALAMTVRAAPDAARARAVAAFHAAGCAGMFFGPAVAGITSAIVRRIVPGEACHQAGLSVGAVGVVLWLAASLRGLTRREVGA